MTQIEIVLLALLYEKDRYGYEMESVIEERNMRNWTKIGFSSIYNALKNLEKKKLICSRYEDAYGSPTRKVYFIKDDVKTTVRGIIKRTLQSPERVYSEFSIGLAFSHLLTKDEVVECLTQYRKSLEDRQQTILRNYSKQPSLQNTIHLKALFTHPLKLIETEIEWIDDLIKDIQEEKNDY
ncbi:MAG: PadR family transcriptional regulator [Chloroflexi bacterium HGW-Chloroflexi-10]|nr:MAG: PadR family transcriptional regulator [Chloroflexi bacterium HGW-Chloroflexi-10]